MLENTTVTLPLKDFEEMRAGYSLFKTTVRRLAACFAYTCTKNPYPQECADCPTAQYSFSLPHDNTGMIHTECTQCATFIKYREYKELLTVDVERLIEFAKEYALYDKDVDTDLDSIPLDYMVRG